MTNGYEQPYKVFKTVFGEIKYNVVGSGEPLILVHGTPWSSFNWRKLIPALSQWFTVYYYDLLGYGESEKNVGDVSLGIQNEILSLLVKHWKLTNPKIVGHDFGGATVLRTYLLNKIEFDQILLIDPVAVSPWGSPFFSHVALNESAFNGLPNYIHEAVLEKYVTGATYSEMDVKTLKGIKKPWLNDEGKKAFYQQIAQSSQKYTDEVEILYSNIKKPIILLWGEEDNWIPIKQGKKLNKMIPSSSLIPIGNAGHLVQEDQPALVLSYILKYFKN
ncbi:alpha/beta hydrolase [Leuconostoc mesenteroides subsp. mesenteroides]|uniref:alpha/beta fold hydrolase n=1 Tax=Leuconostoc mesenteroides TaxID=1245 RepID=UPI000A0012FC|nr:alpha/beta hydrolase [Leuconostoc mesenteroides]ARN63437.1 alpha/beta hydrolase [Leuconostoc mesenteroides subsp. mesenteroides]MDV8926681.1 alpha/beta hydrolase [Leuconostoc mesenteroides]ORI90951.1 alpha/beta hydrolase [Leuconostoc mesenteroides subsp. mesenteroides]ORI91652.1 alpha/beta hydrolase [Leuconostoc mesenteroides subsp. mesenteroides]GEA91898.1 alpha/beta hydrolase [Leuconostoc mesenteroides subsp. mesenteroides]